MDRKFYSTRIPVHYYAFFKPDMRKCCEEGWVLIWSFRINCVITKCGKERERELLENIYCTGYNLQQCRIFFHQRHEFHVFATFQRKFCGSWYKKWSKEYPLCGSNSGFHIFMISFITLRRDRKIRNSKGFLRKKLWAIWKQKPLTSLAIGIPLHMVLISILQPLFLIIGEGRCDFVLTFLMLLYRKFSRHKTREY